MADLTTVARVKAYISLSGTAADSEIARLITTASAAVEKYTSRRFPVVTRTGKRMNGSGTPMLTLPDQPIVSVSALSIGAVTATPSPGANVASGYVHDNTTVYMTDGTVFTAGLQNVQVSYVAGYAGSETGDIPTGNTPTLSPSTDAEGESDRGFPLVSVGVVNATTGAAFTEVDASPAAGEYVFTPGSYVFASADANTPVTMSYYYVPSQIEQAVIEIVALLLKQRTVTGQRSQTIGQQTTTFETQKIPGGIRQLLDPFRRMAPA